MKNFKKYFLTLKQGKGVTEGGPHGIVRPLPPVCIFRDDLLEFVINTFNTSFNKGCLQRIIYKGNISGESSTSFVSFKLGVQVGLYKWKTRIFRFNKVQIFVKDFSAMS